MLSPVDITRAHARWSSAARKLDRTSPRISLKGATFGPTKTKSGENRVIELDDGIVGVLLAHRLRQDVEKATWGDGYVDHGLVFAQPFGGPIPTQQLTQRFGELAEAAGVRHVRLHDLRHGQASLMLAAGVPMAIVSKRLGHSTITITSDTYSHMLAGVGRDAAERANALVPRASRDQSVTTSVADEPISAADGVEGPGNSGLKATGPLAQSVELRTFNP
jgi:integrase